MKRLLLFAALTTGLMGIMEAGWAASFSIEPFKVLMVPAKGKGSQLFKFANAGDVPQAVQIRMETWRQDEAGNELNTDDTTSFEVYPNQFVLPPHGQQNVRITWTKPVPETEQAFRLVAEQLPVDFPDASDGEALRYLLVYRAAVYVAPPKAKSDIVVTGFSKAEAEGKPELILDVMNKGVAHTLLKAPELTVEDGGGQKLVLNKGPQVETLAGQNVMAGEARHFTMPWPEGAGDIKAVSLDFTAGL